MLTAIDRMKDKSGLDLFPHPTIGADIKGDHRECCGIDDQHDLRMIIFGRYKPWTFFATWLKGQGINSGPKVATRAPYP